MRGEIIARAGRGGRAPHCAPSACRSPRAPPCLRGNVRHLVVLAHERPHRVQAVEPHQGHELHVLVPLTPDQVDGAEPRNAPRLDAGDHLTPDDALMGVSVIPGGPASPQAADHAPDITHRPAPAAVPATVGHLAGYQRMAWPAFTPDLSKAAQVGTPSPSELVGYDSLGTNRSIEHPNRRYLDGCAVRPGQVGNRAYPADLHGRTPMPPAGFTRMLTGRVRAVRWLMWPGRWPGG